MSAVTEDSEQRQQPDLMMSARQALAERFRASGLVAPCSVPPVQYLAPETAVPRPGDDALYPYQVHVRRSLEALFTDARRSNLLLHSPTGSGKTFLIEEAARQARLQPNWRVFVAEPLIYLAVQIHARILEKGLLPARGTGAIGLLTGSVKDCEDDPDDCAMIVGTFEVISRLSESWHEDSPVSRLVIIDEIHYIDTDRGSVIQEILHASRNSIVAGLSGTLPNAAQVARYLSCVNELPTIMTGARERPIPLRYSYYSIEDDRCWILRPAPKGRSPGLDPRQIGGLKRQQLLACIRSLEAYESLPMLFILFSCKELDDMADWAASAVDYLNKSERAHVTMAFTRLLNSIPEEDHPLFAPLRLLALKGIGKHHSHLPSHYLELVSELAEKGILRLVFSSSTLSAGINLPVKTVVICSARMPSQNAGFETVSPLLFKQLAGRAGRPGYGETEGYCVIVGYTSKGYDTAQALISRELPHVKFNDDITVGTLLRGRRQGRSIAFERSVFASPELRGQLAVGTETYECWMREWHTASRSLGTPSGDEISLVDCMRLAKSLQAVLAAIDAAPMVFECAVGLNRQSTSCWLLSHGLGFYTVSSEATETIDQYWLKWQLTSLPQVGKRRKEIRRDNLDVFTAADELWQKHLKPLTCWACKDRSVWVWISFAYLYLQQTNDAHSMPELLTLESQRKREISSLYLQPDETLTTLGYAAAHIRALSHPCPLLDLCLGYTGGLDHLPVSLVVFASAALCDGRDKDESEDRTLLLHDWPVLQTLPEHSASRYVHAAKAWFYGFSLVEINEAWGVPAGVACRHIVRVVDVLRELGESSQLLQTEDLSRAVEAAYVTMRRGLPFLQRGLGAQSVRAVVEK